TYTVTFTPPPSLGFTLPIAGDDSRDSDANPVTGSTAPFTLALGQLRPFVDAGLIPAPSSVSGFVYRDLSGDGMRQPSSVHPETGIAGVTVTLTGIDTSGNPITRTTVTLADGSYTFAGLPAGTYTITETQPVSVFVAGQVGFYDGLDSPGTVN